MDRLQYLWHNWNLTYSLIAVNIFLFLLTALLSLIDPAALIFFGADWLPLFLQGNVWQPITSTFLHADIVHLLVNMYSLFYLGTFVERFYSGRAVLVTFMAAGITGSIVSLALTFLSGSAVVSVGASGGIFGLLGLLVGTVYFQDRYGVGLPINQSQLFAIVGINLLLGFLIPQVDNTAHIGGLIAGIALSYLIKPANYFAEKNENIIEWLFRALFVIIPTAFILQLIWAIINF